MAAPENDVRTRLSVRRPASDFFLKMLPVDALHSVVVPSRNPPWSKEESATELKKRIAQSFEKIETHPSYVPIYFQRSSFIFVIASNKLEATLSPSFSKSETFRLLKNAMEFPLQAGELAGTRFPANGSSSDSSEVRRQMFQHMRALQFLMSKVREPLTEQVIRGAHALLMEGAYDSNSNAAIQHGEYRSCPSYSNTGYTYPEPDRIAPQMADVIRQYNEDKKDVNKSITVAARLFYRLVTVHPFEDGNGRLCRMVLAFALIQLGWTKFPVTLSDWHPSKARHHYLAALQQRDRKNDLSHIEYLILLSLHYSWANFETNADMYPSESTLLELAD